MKIRWMIFLFLAGISINLYAQLPKYLYGVASYYSDEYAGKKTASGDLYDPKMMTAAHKTLPFGTVVEVENLENNKKVIVMINDRGPFTEGRLIDLSKAAAESLGFIDNGTAYVMVTMIKLGSGETKGVNVKDYQALTPPVITNTNIISPTAPKPIMTEKLSNGVVSIDYYVTNVLTKVMTKTNAIYITNKVIKVVTNVYTNTIKGNIPKVNKIIENDVTHDPIDPETADLDNNEDFVIEEPFEDPFDPGFTPNNNGKNNNTSPDPVINPDDNQIKEPQNGSKDNTGDTANVAVNDNNVVDLTVPIDDLPEVDPGDIEDTVVEVQEDKVIEDKYPVNQEITPDILISDGESLNDTAIKEEKAIIYDEIEMDVQNQDIQPVTPVKEPNKNNQNNTQNGKTQGDKIKIVNPDEIDENVIPIDKTKIVNTEPDIEIDTDYIPGITGEKYMVQVGAFKDYKNAQKLYDKLKAMGYNVLISNTTVKGALYYRVRIGYYDTLVNASKVAEKMKAMNIPAILVKISVSGK